MNDEDETRDLNPIQLNLTRPDPNYSPPLRIHPNEWHPDPLRTFRIFTLFPYYTIISSSFPCFYVIILYRYSYRNISQFFLSILSLFYQFYPYFHFFSLSLFLSFCRDSLESKTLSKTLLLASLILFFPLPSFFLSFFLKMKII